MWVVLLTSARALAGDVEDELDLDKLLKTDISVSATRMNQTLAEAPAVISVVTRQQIEANNFRSIADALAGIPGLFTNYDHVFYDVGVRGISGELNGSSQLIKVMIDGQPMALRNDHTNLIGLEAIPIDVVERIEVIRGPGSALYGANAFLGVVNIVTRAGTFIEGSQLTLRASTLNGWRPGWELAGTIGRLLGPLDVVFSIQTGQTDRSGLRLPCGTVFANASADPCEAQKAASNDPSIFDRSSRDDLAKPLSVFGRARLDLGKWLAKEESRYGLLSLSVMFQHLDSRANYAEWGVLQTAYYSTATGEQLGPVSATGNRIALDNLVVRGEYDVNLFKDRLNLGVTAAVVRSGVGDVDLLQDSKGALDAQGKPLERSRYGSTAFDVSASALWKMLANAGVLTTGRLAGVTLIDHVTLMASADQTVDRVTYPINSFSVPVTYATSPLSNLGVLAQLTGSFFDRRVGLVAGARYDQHRGAVLEPSQLARYLGDRSKLCENQVCYDSFNYRGGLTATVARNLGKYGGSGAILDELYLKLLYGTAFKAPAPSFLYDDGYYGAQPLKPNSGLRPQTVRSLEAVIGVAALKRSVTGTLVFFTNSLENRVAFFALAADGVVATNSEPVLSRGLEATLNAKFGFVDAAGTFALQSSQKQFPSLRVTDTDTYGFPDWTGTLTVGVTVPKLKTRAGATLRGVGRRVGSPMNGLGYGINSRYELRPYGLLDVNVRAGGFDPFDTGFQTTLTLSARNLLGTSYQYSGFQPYYRTDLPGEPRAVFLGIEQAF